MRLSEAGLAFQQDVATRDECGEDLIKDSFLPEKNLSDFGANPCEKSSRGGDVLPLPLRGALLSFR